MSWMLSFPFFLVLLNLLLPSLSSYELVSQWLGQQVYARIPKNISYRPQKSRPSKK
jgi:hypothetical protein